MISRNLLRNLAVIVALCTLIGVGCNRIDSKLPTLVPTEIRLQPSMTTLPQGSLIDDSPRPAVISPAPPTSTSEPTPSTSPLPATPTDPPPTAVPTFYVVQPGDTLGEIALQFDVDVEELARINNITDADHIEPGQELVIP